MQDGDMHEAKQMGLTSRLLQARLLPLWFGTAILALPIVIWFDLTAMTDQILRRQTQVLNTVVNSVRSYYATNVVGRLDPDGVTETSHDYHQQEGMIPIPATLSIELGELIQDQGLDVSYRFVSDYPFDGRDTAPLNAAETRALNRFRDGTARDQVFLRSGGNLWSHELTLATPVIMEEACVACHNSHAQSPKTDWEIGDIRAVQAFTVSQPIGQYLLTFKHLLVYLVLAGLFATFFSRHQLRLARKFRTMSEELTSNNEFLAGVSLKISRYLSPQVYRSIFSGEKDASISTERKKLTVFFSDIKDFTQTAEQLQPEDLTALLNEYFTEMSKIAATHGATIDKFIGDAIVAFFGDPETRGTAEDARACVRMALEMQARLAELESEWQARGIEHPFQARIGINTGFCNVGNFGSDERMDYTIIGAEANLAARLEASAAPGGIVMSYETYAHVQDIVEARPLPAQRFKGIARDVIPYEVVRKSQDRPLSETSPDGRRVTVHLDRMDEETRVELDRLLSQPPVKP